ncbi:LLM class flavin-dependent oxidoreductase [Streptomyces tubercidicus]|uniref:LLM class flavin-dependent oxidoreductase n=1 Tax=Streptomyces tubercidicus TaxID=47759 RepID=UPI003F5B44DF
MPAASPRRLHLNAFLMNAGHHDAAWRHPRTQPERLTDLRYFQHLAQTAERGKLDSIFFADGLALWGKVKHNALGGFEPLTLLSALATVTERIGPGSTSPRTSWWWAAAPPPPGRRSSRPRPERRSSSPTRATAAPAARPRRAASACPADALYVAPQTYPLPVDEPTVRDEDGLDRAGLLGSYRRRIGWGQGRTPGARLAVGPPLNPPGSNGDSLPITS